MSKFIKYLLITATICVPFAAEAKKCKKKARPVPHKSKVLKAKKAKPKTSSSKAHSSPSRAYPSSFGSHNKVSDLEERVRKLETAAVLVNKKDLAAGKLPKPFVASGNPKSSVALSGQINRLAAYRTNGKRKRLEHLDATASSSRFNMTGTAHINPQFQVQAVIETELSDAVQSFASDVDIGNAAVGSTFADTAPTIRNRRIEGVFKHEKFGTLYVGKGHTSSDGTSEVDFSGTSVVSNASEGGNNLGGFRFYNKTRHTSASQRVASDAFRNMDGLQRANRIRYDSPSMGGLVLGFTHTNTDQSDQSIKYAATFGKTKVGVAVAHAYQPFTTATNGTITQSRRRHTYNGSFGIYNAGFSFGAAGGIEHYKIKTALSSTVQRYLKRRDATFWFVKAGYQAKFINCGNTAFAIDFGYSRANALGETDYYISNHEKAKSYALTIVQNFDSAGTEVYFVARQYTFQQPLSSYKDAIVIVAGTRVKF